MVREDELIEAVAPLPSVTSAVQLIVSLGNARELSNCHSEPTPLEPLEEAQEYTIEELKSPSLISVAVAEQLSNEELVIPIFGVI